MSFRSLLFANVPSVHGFVAIDFASGDVSTSTDASSWTVYSSALPSGFDLLASSGTLLVAVNSTTGDTATSNNGISWSIHPGVMPLAGAVTDYGFAYANGLFCVTEGFSGSDTATSTDGILWNYHPGAQGGGVYIWQLGGNGSIFVGFESGTGAVDISSNGTSWAQHAAAIPIGFQNTPAANITFMGSTWYSVSDDSSGDTATSPNGYTWTVHSAAIPGSIVSRALANYGTKLCFIDTLGNTHVSTDGISWSSGASLSSTYQAIAALQ